MRKLDLDKLAQPYVGRTEDYTKAIFPRATTAELADPAALVNVVGKYLGRMVYDTTLGQPVWASGPLPADTWDAVVVAAPYTVALLAQFEGVDGAVTDTTEDVGARTITFTGSAEIDTAQAAVAGSTSSALMVQSLSWGQIPASDDFTIGVQDFCIEYFLRWSAVVSGRRIIGNGNGSNTGWGMGWESNNLNFVSLGGGLNVSNFAWIPAQDTWYHVACSRDSTTMRAFINGTQIGSDLTNNNNIPQVTAQNFMIGSYGGSAFGFGGWLDSVRFTLGAPRYTENFTAPTAPLTDDSTA